ncbi:MAG: cytidine deaminase [Marinifilaceae bacterium]|jgi:cytidine deaminase|nr:cytidine deaminase [Marinifilaceae bacterium]
MEELSLRITYKLASFDELNIKYQLLISESIKMIEKSYSPYSNFKVGAVVLREDGKMFGGANQENSAFSSCICAERLAIMNSVSNLNTSKIEALAIYNENESLISPCGECRQVILEQINRQKEDFKILMTNGKEVLICKASSLMPFPFKLNKKRTS